MKRPMMAALSAACLALPVAAFAQSGQPNAQVSFQGGSVAAGVGFSWGEGTLVYKGKSYSFKIDGFNVGDVGIAHIDATGDVYNLLTLADFDGNYAAAGVGATVAGGGSLITMQNPRGVVIQVRSTTAGLRLHLGPSGINVQLKE